MVSITDYYECIKEQIRERISQYSQQLIDYMIQLQYTSITIHSEHCCCHSVQSTETQLVYHKSDWKIEIDSFYLLFDWFS